VQNQRQIASYQLGWNHMTNQPLVVLQLQNTPQLVPLQVQNADELNALVAILGHSPVFFRGDGLVFTGQIPA
jgi:hypothetical protein